MAKRVYCKKRHAISFRLFRVARHEQILHTGSCCHVHILYKLTVRKFEYFEFIVKLNEKKQTNKKKKQT